MAFLSSDELDALHVQIAHDAEVAARPPEPSYPLAPTYVSPPETAAPVTAYPLAPTITAPPTPDSSAYGPISPYVTPETAPGEYGTNPYTPPVTDKWGNPQITLSDGTTTWSNNIGQIWDSATQSWVDSTAPTALGNYYGAVQNAPSYSDISQARTAWENAPNPTNGSRFDRLGFSEAPTNRELADFYRDLPQPASTDYGPGKFALNYGGGQDEFLGAPQQTIGAAPKEPFFGSRGFYRDEGGDNSAFGLGGLTGLARRGLDAATVAGNIGAYVNPVTQPAAIARAVRGDPFLDPFDRQQSILDTAGTVATDLTRGNALVKDLGGPDLDTLPYGLNYVTDTALAPATWITAGAGSEAPIIGSVFKGGFGKRLLGETAVGAATLFGGEKAAEKAAEYTDNPYLIGGAGVLGGAVTGLGVLGGIKAAERAPGAIKAADRALTGLDAKLMEPGGSFGRQATVAGMERQVFHGTPEPDITLADLKPGELTGRGTSPGLFFSESPDVAGSYIGRWNGKIIEATIEDKNFLDLTDERTFRSFLKDQGFDRNETDSLWALAEEGRLYDDNVGRTQGTIIRSAKNAGYDGVKMNDAVPGYFDKGLEPVDVSYVVLDPTKPGVITSLKESPSLAAKLNDETGALDMGAVGERFGEAGKRAARIFADAAEKEGRPTTGGIFDMLAPTERAGTGLVRRYEGAVGTAGLELKQDLDLGNKLLRQADVPKAKWDGTRLTVQRSPEMEQLFKALHGEGPPPPKLQTVYDTLKDMVAKETTATIDADKAFVPRDDYFYRGWKEVPVGKAQNAGTGKGQFGAKPGFMKPRSDQSFSDILNTVYTKPDGTQVRLEPISWNPFEMAAIRKTAGEQFRAQNDLLAGLKETGMAVSADIAPDGWRVPRVGPAFEGKPFAFTPAVKDTGPMARLADEGGAAVGYTSRIAVPDKVANDIESIFGRQPSFGALDAVLSAGQKAKQSKLLFSLFQQMDFSARTLGALNASVIDELAESVTKAVKLQPGASAAHLVAAGRKFLAIPKDLAELPLANISGAAQRRLRAGILDATPIYKERPGITLKGVSEAGAKFGTDISLVTRDIMADITKGPKPAYLTTGVIGRRIRQMNAASQRGLFDGWYVQAQETALKKTILPRIMRQHPDWTDAQIMAGGADEVNKMFSTLGEYQTVIKNPAVKKLARGLIFSTNETEALLRGAASTVVGPNKRLWTEFYLGTFLGLAAIAETIHYATTGEHLPVERLNPIDTENKYGPLPFGYRTNFLAPDIPIKGRNGTRLTLDTVMQMDTIFRLLDPKAFVESRENVLPRAAANQITGKDFYGRPLKSPLDRAAQAAIDLFEPIGAGNLRAAAGIGPDSEARIGTAGALIQTAGANVRAENNAALRDRAALEFARSTGATKADGSPITGYADLDPLQRKAAIESNPDIQRELKQRGEEAVEQGSEYAIQAAKRKADAEAIRADNVRIQQEIDAKYIKPGATAPTDYEKGKAWREERDRLQYSIARQFDAKEIMDPFTGKPYGSDMDEAKRQYYEAIKEATSGTEINWDKVDAWRAQNPAAAALVDKYTAGKENTDLSPAVTAKKEASKKLGEAGFFDLRDDLWKAINAQSPAPGYVPGQGYYDWRAAQIERVTQEMIASGIPPATAPTKAETYIDTKFAPVSKFNDYYKTTILYPWVNANPELAETAVQWGYLYPDTKIQKFFQFRSGR